MRLKKAEIVLIIITALFALAAGAAVSREAGRGVTLYALPAPTGESAQTAYDGLIDLNTSDQEQLEALPGIGQSLAAAIVDYRREHGPFTSADQLILVPGIGEKTLEKARAYITVNP